MKRGVGARLPFACALALFASLACSEKGPAPAKTSTPAATKEDRAPAPTPAHVLELVVASPERGVSEHYWGGQQRTKLSATPGLSPAIAPDGSAVYFLGVDRSVRRIDVASGAESVLTSLPTPAEAKTGTCAATLEPGELEVDLQVIADELCVAYRPCGSTTRHDVWMHATTGETRASSDGSRPCPDAPDTSGEPTGNFRVDRGQLYRVRDGVGTALMQIGDPEGGHELTSPSGRWQVFSDLLARDRNHRSLYMVDTEVGSVHPLLPGPWPSAVAAGNLLHLGDVESLSVVDSSRVRWLAGRDLLVVDTILVAPGVGISDLGHVAALPPGGASVAALPPSGSATTPPPGP